MILWHMIKCNSDFRLKDSQVVEQKSNDGPKIIAAIPCLNEEAFIGDIVTRAKKYIDKVIVVDYYGGNKFWGKSNLAHLLFP